MDIDSKNLFPEINPNVEELIEKENSIDPDEIIKDDLDYSKPKTKAKDIFMKPSRQNIKLKVKEPTDTIVEEDIKPKKDRYAHLARARQKGIETRKRKAEEKRKAKAEAKSIKDEEKRLRKEATAERNRVNARNRYYKQKEAKQNVAEKIVEKTKPIPKQSIKAPVRPQNNGNMDFNTFAKYMMKYEEMKDAYNKQKAKPKSIKSKPKSIPEKPKPSYHPKNYPLNMYAPTNRYKEFNGF